MPEEAEKLLHFTDTVLRSAEQENAELTKKLESKRKAALHAAQLAARESAQAYYDREAAKIRAEAGREISRHLMEGKRQVYLRRSQVSKEVMDQVRQRLDQFVTSPEYPEHLKMMLADAMKELPGVEEITLRLRKEDLPLGPMLAESIAPVRVTSQEGRFHIGGLAVRCPQLGVRIDCSFDSQLEELSGHFAETFGLSLSDELDEG
jgi:vacuolar-type H+-ATPase subunit E/Vma4